MFSIPLNYMYVLYCSLKTKQNQAVLNPGDFKLHNNQPMEGSDVPNKDPNLRSINIIF